MNLILNRSFELPEDGWYQLAPLGEFPHSASGTVQVIDAESCTRMVSAFENARTASDRFAGLLIDFDHFSLDAEKKSEAAGWITDLKFVPPLDDPGSSVPESGLYACIRWSDIGEVSVKGGRYRFLSPVWARADCEDLGDKRLRPVRLLNAAVTNDPNLKGLLPLSNRTPKPLTDNPELLTDNRAKGAPFDSVLSDRDPDLTQENWMKNLIAALLKKLNLPADSDEEVIQSAIENMTPPDEVEALLNRAETAESELETLSREKLEADADAFLMNMPRSSKTATRSGRSLLKTARSPKSSSKT